MLDTSTDKRKYFRFPAYDDEVGVKLLTNRKRVLFEDDFPIITKEGKNRSTTRVKNQNFDYTETMNRGDSSSVEEQPQYTGITRGTPRSGRISSSNRTQNSYAPKSFVKEGKREQKKQSGLFGQQLKYAEESRKKADEFAKKARVKPNHISPLDNYQPKSHFVPKYIPASNIQEKESVGKSVAKHDLLDLMQKSQDSYLLFDNDDSSNINEAPATNYVAEDVTKTGHLDIPVTRRQFQKIKSDVPDFSNGEYNEIHSLPRSRMGLKNAKIQVKNDSAYGMKQEEKNATSTKRRHNRLEKSLSGIMNDETSKFENKYFD